jgi:hypothetical protein
MHLSITLYEESSQYLEEEEEEEKFMTTRTTSLRLLGLLLEDNSDQYLG